MNFNDLSKDVMKIIFQHVFHNETIPNINKMKLLSKKICKVINEMPTLYHGKYMQLWDKSIGKHSYGRSHVKDLWWRDTFSDLVITLKTPQCVRFMDEKHDIISDKAHQLWLEGFSNDGTTNWFEAIKRLVYIYDE